MKVLHVVGARPNFVKIAPLMEAFDKYPGVEQILVHTGQHYEHSMSQAMMDDLDMPAPDEYLKCGSGTHAEQTANIMLAFEPVLFKHQPDWTIVTGDVNSAMACALAAAKQCFKVAHIEAGLRCWDRTLPEETNRVIIDHVSDLLFTHCRQADENLLREGVAPEKIHFVGNIVMDSVRRVMLEAKRREAHKEYHFERGQYILATLHRPFNVDGREALLCIISALNAMPLPVIFSTHPRTKKRLADAKIATALPNIAFIGPQAYIRFLSLLDAARLVITDSGGVQEEATYLGVPCLVVRPNTERPICLSQGTSRLVQRDEMAITQAVASILAEDSARKFPVIKLWDGCTADRIAKIMVGAG